MTLPGADLIELLRATLAKGMPFRFRATGSSMHPFIKHGDVIIVSTYADASPSLGDVVAIVQQGTEKLVIHRIVGRKRNTCLVKGDNTTGIEGPIPRANILGYVKSVERNDKKVLLGLGPERFLIALLTRANLTIPLVRLAVKLLRSLHTMITL